MLFDDFPEMTREEWKQLILKSIKTGTEDEKRAFYQDKLVQRPESGLEIQPFYVLEDLAELEYLKGFHQLWAQTRKTTGWMNVTMIAVYDEDAANLQAHEEVSKGADTVTFNLLNRPGGKPMVDGSLTTEHFFDFAALLKGLSLGKIPVYFQMYRSQLTGLSNYLQSTEKDTTILMGGIIFWEISLWSMESEIEKDAFAQGFQNSIFSKGKTPYFKPFLIEPVGEMLDDTEEMETFALPAEALLKYQLQAAIGLVHDFGKRNISAKDVLPQIGFVTDINDNYFLEIAKLRVLRLLWWQIGQLHDASLNLIDVFIHANTIRLMPPEKEPYKSMLTNTTQAMSAIIGGCDALTVQPGAFTETNDTILAQRVARNVSVILKEESYFDKVTDIGAGSYLIENLTHQLAKAVWEQLSF